MWGGHTPLAHPPAPSALPMLDTSRHTEALELEPAGFTPKFVASGYVGAASALAACERSCKR